MVIYRPHRAYLSDSLAHAQEFETMDDMKLHIVRCYEEVKGYKPFDLEDIVVMDDSVDDSRCGWHDTRYVCINRFGEEKYEYPQCIGMCATDYDKSDIVQRSRAFINVLKNTIADSYTIFGDCPKVREYVENLRATLEKNDVPGVTEENE